ncbi:MAG TPA: glutathionylspermidine synthase family protein [Candidatus Methylacidiphilales bacterium]|nr:glutathionylspermidine synthase family protein [Candidatus Methylacidiphilales bacterium]
MKRREITPRPDWRPTVEQQGLLYHTNPDGAPYWDESACYELSLDEIERLERAANELHGMLLEACRIAIERRMLADLGIPETMHEPIRKSWRYDDWDIHGRFDFTLAADGTPKLLEYNADTPSGLLETSIVQWYWKEQCRPEADQLNSVHESLIARWKLLLRKGQVWSQHTLYLSSSPNHAEDRIGVSYMGETAEQAGLTTRYLDMSEIGWNLDLERFVDLDDQPIEQLCKLYPWDWMAYEDFAFHLRGASWHIFEPPWKMLCSSKGLLLLLQELYPGHPNLLRVSRDPNAFTSFARKPFFGREGHNISLVIDGRGTESSDGPYDEEPILYQEYCPLISTGTNFAQLGVWMVGDEACGLGIREDTHPILRGGSRFVPHIIV